MLYFHKEALYLEIGTTKKQGIDFSFRGEEGSMKVAIEVRVIKSTQFCILKGHSKCFIVIEQVFCKNLYMQTRTLKFQVASSHRFFIFMIFKSTWV